jgi:hypothetical protein
MSKNSLSSSSFKDAFNNLENFDNLENFADYIIDKSVIRGAMDVSGNEGTIRDGLDTTNNYSCAYLSLPEGKSTTFHNADNTPISLNCTDNYKAEGKFTCKDSYTKPINCCNKSDIINKTSAIIYNEAYGLHCASTKNPNTPIQGRYICTNNDNDVCYLDDTGNYTCISNGINNVPKGITKIYTRVRPYLNRDCDKDQCDPGGPRTPKDRWIDEAELSVCDLTNQNLTTWKGYTLPDWLPNKDSICQLVNYKYRSQPMGCTYVYDSMQGLYYFDTEYKTCKLIQFVGKPKGVKIDAYYLYPNPGAYHGCKGEGKEISKWEDKGTVGDGIIGWCASKFTLDSNKNPYACDAGTRTTYDNATKTCKLKSMGEYHTMHDCCDNHSTASGCSK